MHQRGAEDDLDTFTQNDEERRALLRDIEELRHKKNIVSEKIGGMIKNKEDASKLIKEMRKTMEKPVLKAAFVEESVYIGDDQLEALSNIKSKDELLGDLAMLLQSPARNLVSALASSGSKMAGALKSLSEKEN